MGYHRPVTLYSSAGTSFRAQKRLVLGEAELDMAPADCSAQTRSKTTSISSWLPGLRGAIANRIAWRRVDEMRAQIDAIESQHAAALICRELDERINQSVAAVQDMLRVQVPKMPLDRSLKLLSHLRSTPDYIEVVMYRRDATAKEGRMQLPPIEGNPDIVIRAHRIVVRSAVTSAEIRQAIRPLLSGLLKAQIPTKALRAAREAESTQQFQFHWSVDRNWIVVDYVQVKAQGRLTATERDGEPQE